jgi:hypothetical protein
MKIFQQVRTHSKLKIALEVEEGGKWSTSNASRRSATILNKNKQVCY